MAIELESTHDVLFANTYMYRVSRNILPEGHQTGMLEIPERPTSLAFGGPDSRTLYIGARGGSYSIQTAAPGK